MFSLSKHAFNFTKSLGLETRAIMKQLGSSRKWLRTKKICRATLEKQLHNESSNLLLATWLK